MYVVIYKLSFLFVCLLFCFLNKILILAIMLPSFHSISAGFCINLVYFSGSSPPADLVSKAKERRLRMDSGTFDRPTSKVAVQSLPRDASVSEERMDEGIDDDDYVSSHILIKESESVNSVLISQL